MRRSNLQGLAESKLRDSIFLFEHGSSSNAYYLAGYSVELGLKACIAKQIPAETIPDRSILKDLFSQEFQKLIGLSCLKAELEDKKRNSSQFGANWAIPLEWNPDVRYQLRTAIEAQYLLKRIAMILIQAMRFKSLFLCVSRKTAAQFCVTRIGV